MIQYTRLLEPKGKASLGLIMTKVIVSISSSFRDLEINNNPKTPDEVVIVDEKRTKVEGIGSALFRTSLAILYITQGSGYCLTLAIKLATNQIKMTALNDFDGCTSHGPWGVGSGNQWAYKPKVLAKKIRICVKYGRVVHSINFQTNCGEGEHQSSFGGTGGDQSATICIDYPKEYMISISGVCCYCDGFYIVSSLSFKTNLNHYGPYGVTSFGSPAFSYDVKDGVIAGFYGYANDKYITAIGVYVIPKPLASPPDPTSACKIKNELFSSLSRTSVGRDAGPWGAGGGKPWDDGVFSAVQQVCIHLGELNVIYALQFEYLKSDAKPVMSEIHGGSDGIKTELVKLDDKDEFLTGVSGFYGPVEGYNGLEAIVLINFHTNKRIYGPYGEERGKGNVYFSSTPSPGRVVGFHGRTNGFLSAIGVLKEYF